MRILQRASIFLFLLVFLPKLAFSQVSGVSYILSPSAQYNWWDNKAGLEDGILYGGRLGFGFGEFLELRGSYLFNDKLKTNFTNFGLPNFADSLYTSRTVSMHRYGGELKANLGKGTFIPYLTVGTGIQKMGLDTFATNKQIYVDLGLGIKLSAGDRYVFTLEGKNLQYNYNAVQSLMTQGERTTFDVNPSDYTANRLKGNWALNASLQFHIGGRRPGTMSEIDQAYFAAFNDGLRGARIPLEPAVLKVNFDEALPYRDTWFGGGYAGVDFGPYVGIRGFYMQGMQNNKLDFDFDNKIALYGGEMRMNLNAPRGLVPYLIVGGGNIDVKEGYVAKDTTARASDQGFALGGVGIIMPLGKRTKVFGSYRTMLTTASKVENLQSVDDVVNSGMFGFGLNLTIGKKAKRPDVVYSTTMDKALLTQQAENDAQASVLKSDYEAKVVQLEQDLNKAYAEKDLDKAAALLLEKDQAEAVVAEINKREVKAEQQRLDMLQGVSSGQINMSAAEFQNLIDEIMENGNAAAANNNKRGGNDDAKSIEGMLRQQETERQLGDIDKALTEINQRQKMQTEIDAMKLERLKEDLRHDQAEFSTRLLLEIQKMQLNNGQMPYTPNVQNVLDSLNRSGAVQPGMNNIPSDLGRKPMEAVGDYVAGEGAVKERTLKYTGMSGITGLAVGKGARANIGLRWNYKIKETAFELMPETFMGFGNKSAFGLGSNIVYPFNMGGLRPYLGTGLGFIQAVDGNSNKLSGTWNLILGTYLNVANGRLFIDYTTRNLFDRNQLTAGYRFNL